jgi:hypothetical protein
LISSSLTSEDPYVSGDWPCCRQELCNITTGDRFQFVDSVTPVCRVSSSLILFFDGASSLVFNEILGDWPRCGEAFALNQATVLLAQRLQFFQKKIRFLICAMWIRSWFSLIPSFLQIMARQQTATLELSGWSGKYLVPYKRAYFHVPLEFSRDGSRA